VLLTFWLFDSFYLLQNFKMAADLNSVRIISTNPGKFNFVTNPWNYSKHKKRDGYQMNIFRNKTLAYSTAKHLTKKNRKKKKRECTPPHTRACRQEMSRINND